MKKLNYFLKAFLLFTITFCATLKPATDLTEQIKSLEDQLEPTQESEAAFNEKKFLKELELVFENRDQLKNDDLENFIIILQRAQVHQKIEYENIEKIKNKLYKIQEEKKENFIVQLGRLIEKNKKLSEKDKDQYFDLLIKIKENQKKLKRELARSKLFSDRERFGPARRTRATLPPRTRLGKTIDPFFGEEERGIRGRRSRPSLYERPSSGRPLDYLARDRTVIGRKFGPKEKPKPKKLEPFKKEKN